MADFELPLKKLPVERVNPKTLLLYSLPKIGKTELLSQLPGCLILDFEGGTEEKEALKMHIIGLMHSNSETEESKVERYKRGKFYLTEILAKLKQNNPYRYIAMDTLSSYEDMCHLDATMRYMKSPMGINYNRYDEIESKLSGGKVIAGQIKPRTMWSSVITMPKGAGYYWLRESYEFYIKELQALGINLVLIAHVKTTILSGKNEKTGTEVDQKDLQLTGKIKEATVGMLADSIGYISREGKENWVSFEPSDSVMCGSRSKHLAGNKILISKQLEDKSIETYWNKIYI